MFFKVATRTDTNKINTLSCKHLVIVYDNINKYLRYSILQDVIIDFNGGWLKLQKREINK